jgi:hypothetical protein
MGHACMQPVVTHYPPWIPLLTSLFRLFLAAWNPTQCCPRFRLSVLFDGDWDRSDAENKMTLTGGDSFLNWGAPHEITVLLNIK